MADIVINVSELFCEVPEVTHSEWTGARYVFSVDYISKGEEYVISDPSTNMELSIYVYENTGTTPILVYEGVINPSAPFNATGYTFDVYDYTELFSSKFILRLKLKLSSDRMCNVETTYQFPVDYP